MVEPPATAFRQSIGSFDITGFPQMGSNGHHWWLSFSNRRDIFCFCKED